MRRGHHWCLHQQGCKCECYERHVSASLMLLWSCAGCRQSQPGASPLAPALPLGPVQLLRYVSICICTSILLPSLSSLPDQHCRLCWTDDIVGLTMQDRHTCLSPKAAWRSSLFASRQRSTSKLTFPAPLLCCCILCMPILACPAACIWASTEHRLWSFWCRQHPRLWRASSQYASIWRSQHAFVWRVWRQQHASVWCGVQHTSLWHPWLGSRVALWDAWVSFWCHPSQRRFWHASSSGACCSGELSSATIVTTGSLQCNSISALWVVLHCILCPDQVDLFCDCALGWCWWHSDTVPLLTSSNKVPFVMLRHGFGSRVLLGKHATIWRTDCFVLTAYAASVVPHFMCCVAGLRQQGSSVPEVCRQRSGQRRTRQSIFYNLLQQH